MKQAVVTITIKKAASDDPIVSWISVSGQEAPESEPVAVSYTHLTLPTTSRV